MTKPSEMPGWPERPPIYHEPGELDDEKGNASCDVCHAYERARADAWEARCRVAVEALQIISRDWHYDDDGIVRPVKDAGAFAIGVLDVIGDLPPLPPQQQRTNT